MARLLNLKNRLAEVKWRRWVLLGTLLLLLAFGGYRAWRVWGLMHSLQDRLNELQAVADGSTGAGLGEAGDSLRGAYADLETLQGETGFLMPLTRFLGWVPGVGGDLQAAPVLLDVALSVTEAGISALNGLEPLVALTENDNVGGQTMAMVVETLSNARPSLETAQERLAAALERRPEIDDSTLSARTASLVAQLDRYLPLMRSALDGARLLPDLLGASRSRTYLILAQNNDELRATGGFISAVGKLTLDEGEIVEIVFEDSYAVDDFHHPYPDSPLPVLRYMGIDQWVFRDSNWSPDFPTSAQKAIELYRVSRELEVDGVLAVDQHALQTIVAALAPLEVEGWPEPLTEDNVIPLVRLAWSPTELENWSGFDVAWWRQRKRFIGDLFGAMQAKVETAPEQINWLVLGRAVVQALDERQLQIWLVDSTGAAADLLAEQGWNGAVHQTIGDYLMVVDANLGYNKVNAVIQESLDYRVLVGADGSIQSTLTLQHVNGSTGGTTCDPRPHYGADYDDLINRCYWDYLRVYVPAGSQLFAATAHPISADLVLTGQRQLGAAEVLPEGDDKTIFASFFVLPRGQEIESRFVYQLPEATLERGDAGWRYRLLVQKQAGTSAIPLHVTVVLPPGSSVQSAELFTGTHDGQAALQPEPSTVVFDVTLERDRFFEVVFQPNEN